MSAGFSSGPTAWSAFGGPFLIQVISFTLAAQRLRSARAHFVQRPVGLASALCASAEIFRNRARRVPGRSGPPPRSAAEGCRRERKRRKRANGLPYARFLFCLTRPGLSTSSREALYVQPGELGNRLPGPPQFSEENQDFLVPASVQSVAFPSADEASIFRNSTPCKNQCCYAQDIHHDRWISGRKVTVVAMLTSPCTASGHHKWPHGCCAPRRHRRCETTGRTLPHFERPAGCVRLPAPHNPSLLHCWSRV